MMLAYVGYSYLVAGYYLYIQSISISSTNQASMVDLYIIYQMVGSQNTPAALVFESRPPFIQNIVNRSAFHFRYPSLFYPFQSLFPLTNT